MGGVRDAWVEVARVCGDAEPLPPGVGDSAGESGGGDALVAEHVFDAVQPVPTGARASVSGAVSGDLGGNDGGLGGGRGLHPPQSGAGGDRGGGATGGVSVEQFAEVYARAAAGVARGGGFSGAARVDGFGGGVGELCAGVAGVGRRHGGAGAAGVRRDVEGLGHRHAGLAAGAHQRPRAAGARPGLGARGVGGVSRGTVGAGVDRGDAGGREDA